MFREAHVQVQVRREVGVGWGVGEEARRTTGVGDFGPKQREPLSSFNQGSDDVIDPKRRARGGDRPLAAPS